MLCISTYILTVYCIVLCDLKFWVNGIILLHLVGSLDTAFLKSINAESYRNSALIITGI